MKNSVKWDKIPIYQAELDSLLPLNIFDNWAIEICRVLILRNKKYFRPLLITEAAILFLEIVLLFPLNLIIFRNLELTSNNSYGLILIFLLSIIIALCVLLLLNYLSWHRAKRFKTIAIILEKVEDFNCLINTLKTLTELSYFSNFSTQDSYESSIKLSGNNLRKSSSELSLDIEEVLLVTRTSLLQSIQIHNALYLKTSNKRDISQLFANLENKLIYFISSPPENSSTEYQQTLEEIINLGLTVHQELKKQDRLP